MSQRNLPSLPVQPQAAPFEFDEYSPATRDDISVRSLMAMLRRHRLLIASSILGTVVLVGAYTEHSKPVYEATSELRFEEEQVNLPQLLQDLSTENRVNTEVEVLQNRTSAAEVIDSLGLRAQVIKPRQATASQDFSLLRVSRSSDTATLVLSPLGGNKISIGLIGSAHRISAQVGDTVKIAGVTLAARAALLATPETRIHVASLPQAVHDFESALKVDRPVPDADLITIQMSDVDPIRASAAANLLAEQRISGQQRLQVARSGSAVEFLTQQLDTLGNQLRSAEDALQAYTEQAGAVDATEQATTQVGRLAQIQADRGSVEAERDALAALLQQIQTASARDDSAGEAPSSQLISFPTLFRNQAASELLGSLAQVQNERADLLTRRTPNDPDVQVLTNRIHEIDTQLRGIAETYLQGLNDQVASLDGVAKQFGGALDSLPAKEVETARLQRDVQVRQDLYTLIQTRLKEAQITGAMSDPTVSIVDRAVVADKPAHPKPLLNLALSLVLGSIIGVAGAFGRDISDHSVRSRADALQASGIPVLGAIPRVRLGRWQHIIGSRASRSRHNIRELLVTSPRASAAYVESFNQLHANLVLSYQERPLKVLVVTSPLPGEGKTLSAVNLALTVAARGRRVLLIDADLRCGVVDEVFGFMREPGFAELLKGSARFEDVTRSVSVDGGALSVLPSGRRAASPGRLFVIDRVRHVLEELAAKYDMVVIDSPPVNLLADASLLGAAADGVLLVVRTGHTRVEELSYAMDQLSGARAPVIGTLLNDIDARRNREDESYRYLVDVERYAGSTFAPAVGRS